MSRLLKLLSEATTKAEIIRIALQIASLVGEFQAAAQAQAQKCANSMLRQNLVVESTQAGNMGVQLKVICAVKAAQQEEFDASL